MWQDEVRAWVANRRSLADCDPQAAVTFFEHALDAVVSPGGTWFGVHPGRISLVIGGVFLAALHTGKLHGGIWLLLSNEQPLPDLGHLTYAATKEKHRAPNLVWARSRSFAGLAEINSHEAIWQALRRAAEIIPTTPWGAPRDSVQLQRKKISVSTLLNLPLDRILALTPEDQQLAVRRMAETARKTVMTADGRTVSRRLKVKDLRFQDNNLEQYIDELIVQQKRCCAISGLPFEADKAGGEFQCSLDRIDSSGHYEPGNLQVVCKFINRWKSDSNDREFRRLLAHVVHAAKVKNPI